jgi:hypothetical protein
VTVYPSVCGGQGRDRSRQRIWRGLWQPATAYGPEEVVHAITGDSASESGALYLSIQTHLSTSANRPGSGENCRRTGSCSPSPGPAAQPQE